MSEAIKTVFLYAGQGAQKVGMGKDIYEVFPKCREIMDRYGSEAVLGFDAKALMWEEEETLMQTEYTQPCMALFAASVTEILREAGIVPDAACGLSLGEYGALYAAGIWDVETYLKLVAFRGKTMADCVRGMDAAMSAIIGLSADQTNEACKMAASSGYVTVANYNYPGQYVICGERAAVEAAEGFAKELGAKRTKQLAVSGPFHTKYLAPAGDSLADYFETIDWKPAKIPVAMNYTGKLLGKDEDVKKLLSLQVCNSVRMEEDLKLLLDLGVSRFIEIGPGKVLSGFVKKTLKALEIEREVECISLQTAEDLQALIGV